MNRSKALKLIFAYFVAILLLGSTALPVRSQQVVEFENFHTETTFLENIRFTVDLCGLPPKANAILHVRFSHDNWEIIPAFVDQATSNSCAKGRYTYRMRDYPPFLSIEYYWQVYLPGSGFLDSPHQSSLYEDTRYQWQKLESENITLFWHDRPAWFGQQLLEIAEKADKAQRVFFGLELKYPYRIVIFNTAEEFFGWNVDSSDYVAGESYPFYDLTVQIVEDDSPDWVNEVIPHEIAHLYFEQAAYHPKPKSYPPNWLNEGVAVSNEFSDHSYEDQILRKAVREDGILPLYELAGTFGDEDERVDLAYAEGYSAVSYLMEQYGRDALKKLLNSYRRGVSTDEAFNTAIQKSSLQFEIEWKEWLMEKYSEEFEILPPELNPFPTEETSSKVGLGLSLSVCILGFAPILCLLAVAGGSFLAILIGRTLRT